MNGENSKPVPQTVIQWLCRDCYERLKETPGRTRSGKKYSLWEAGRWQKDGECFLCKGWKLLTMYELEDMEAREYRRRMQELKESAYGRKKDTRARYRPRYGED